MAHEELDALLQDGLIWLAEDKIFVEQHKAKIRQLFNPNLNAASSKGSAACFGVPEIDQVLPRQALQAGELHEFSYIFSEDAKRYPPCSILSLLAANAAARSKRAILWIGRSIWPTPYLLEKVAPHTDFLARNIFIDPPSKKLTLWAIESSLRSHAAAVVIADLTNMSMALSRRLSLAAKQGNTLGFIVRNYKKGSALSAASTRWKIAPMPSNTANSGFKLQLLKLRGAKPLTDIWSIEVCDGETEQIFMRLSTQPKERGAVIGEDRALGSALYATGRSRS